MNESSPAYVLEAVDPWRDWRRVLSLVKRLTKRNLAARYRGSYLGFFWSLLNPVLMMCVYTLVFRYVLRLSAPGVPFPAFFLTGLMAWNFFQVAVMNSATSVVANRPLIDTAYFPRIAIPLAAVLSGLFNYLLSMPILLVFNLLLGVRPGIAVFVLPLAILQLTLFATGVGLIYASLVPFFRDLEQFLEVVHLAWFFATPVIYPASMVRENLPLWAFRLFELNPMLGTVSLLRAAFLREEIDLFSVGISSVGTLVVLIAGVTVYNRLAPRFSLVA